MWPSSSSVRQSPPEACAALDPSAPAVSLRELQRQHFTHRGLTLLDRAESTLKHAKHPPFQEIEMLRRDLRRCDSDHKQQVLFKQVLGWVDKANEDPSQFDGAVKRLWTRLEALRNFADDNEDDMSMLPELSGDLKKLEKRAASAYGKSPSAGTRECVRLAKEADELADRLADVVLLAGEMQRLERVLDFQHSEPSNQRLAAMTSRMDWHRTEVFPLRSEAKEKLDMAQKAVLKGKLAQARAALEHATKHMAGAQQKVSAEPTYTGPSVRLQPGRGVSRLANATFQSQMAEFNNGRFRDLPPAVLSDLRPRLAEALRAQERCSFFGMQEDEVTDLTSVPPRKEIKAVFEEAEHLLAQLLDDRHRLGSASSSHR
ncbi:hypothetical protein [Roseateles amylovorans]|uniref:Uncharacterized protein n=1 Tax=Roseateles amylovorans TaxID=2978473 RepID=A0ABY6AYG1_9BURK|nr:hypothetical protein [Roseateles amylovorans]UXH77439.1 hypothetical protein N4261_20945 [Roseateles amylovorans]